MKRTDFRPNTTTTSGMTANERKIIQANKYNYSESQKDKERIMNKQLPTRNTKIEMGDYKTATSGYVTDISGKKVVYLNNVKYTKKGDSYINSNNEGLHYTDINTRNSSATNHSEQLDYDDYVEYSGAKNKYVKVKSGYGDYEYLKYSDAVREDGSSEKPIERNVIGYPTLYSAGGQKAYGFNSVNKLSKGKMTLSEIKNENSRAGQHFFSDSTMRMYRQVGAKYRVSYDKKTDTNYVIVNMKKYPESNERKNVYYKYNKENGHLDIQN